MFLITQSKIDHARPKDESRYIADRVAQATSFEIRQQSLPPNPTASLDIYALLPLLISGQIAGKVLDHTINFYDGDAFMGLPYGQVDKRGALVRSEQLVLTEEVLAVAYGTPPFGVPPYFSKDGPTVWTAEYPQEFRNLFPASAGYIYHPGTDPSTPYQKGYYAVIDSNHYDFQDSATGRGLLVGELDALGHESTIVYDSPYSLLPVQVKDAAGLITRAEYDYRLLRPRLITDANGNRGFVTYTPLGLAATAGAMGKVTETLGDTEAVPGTIYAYNFSSLPISVRTEKRIFHATDTSADPAIKDQTIATVEYSDGFGRVVQTRTRAEELLFGDPVFGGGVVPADQTDPNAQSPVVGRLNSDSQNPNVTVSGWQLYDNKGQVTRKFEPFFSTGWQYSAPTQAQLGQSSRLFNDPRGQLVRTVNADGSEHRVVHGVPGTRAQPDLTNPDIFEPTPWESYVYDVNDNAGRTHATASSAYSQHWNTPGNSSVDALGRTIRSVKRNGPNPATDWFEVRSTFDIRGNRVEARDELGRVVVRTVYDLANRPLRTFSLDGGENIVVVDAAGNQIEARDSKGALTLNSHDLLNRSIRIWARDNSTSSLTLRQRMVYGDHADSGLASPQTLNLLGKVFRHYDEAGLVTNERFDFKGNGLDSLRQVIKDAEILKVIKDAADKSFQVDWQPAPGSDLAAKAAILLDANNYRTSSTFDAVNKIQTLVYPVNEGARKAKRSELRMRYNRAGALEQVTVDGVVYVKHIAYNAKGERTLIAYGNGVLTRYAYEPATFRLSRLRSEKFTSAVVGSFQPAGPALQDYRYTYDLIGNVLQIVDRTPGCGVLNNPEAGQVQDPALAALMVQGNALVRRFTYDPIYRLLSGNGRECSNLPSPRPWLDDPRCGFVAPGKKPTPDQDNAPALTSIYQEAYSYDPAGNMLVLKHIGKSATWVRNFGIGGMTPQQWAAEWPKHSGAQLWSNPVNNRLTHVGDNQPAPPQTHSYDVCGNLTSETTSRRFEWDHSDRLRRFRIQPASGVASIQVQYLYDGGGQRVKKIVVKQDGTVESLVYVGDFEHHVWSNGDNIKLHVMDNKQRIALVRVGTAHPSDPAPEVQFHLGDHVGSSGLVIDNAGTWINREEYTPYGETIFGSYAQKRYRFTGKERDEESGLYYHGARYYAPWIARWTSCDPAGIAGGTQFYCYAFNNPTRFHDPDGCFPAPYELADKWEQSGMTPIFGIAPIPGVTGEKIAQAASDLGDKIGGAIVDALPPDNLGGIFAAALVKTVFDVGGGLVAGVADPAMAIRGVMRFGTASAQGVEDIEKGHVVLGVSRIVGEAADGVGMVLGGVSKARSLGVPGTYQKPAAPTATKTRQPPENQRKPFREATQRALKKLPKDDPVRKALLKPNGKLRSGRGKRNGPAVEAGHLDAKTSKKPQRFALQDADENMRGGETIESHNTKADQASGAVMHSVFDAVEIRPGVHMVPSTLKQYIRLGVFPESVGAGAKPSSGWTWSPNN